ncbi:hypothetical protein XENOCAPTIV_026316 [Xenoophorus captivus]|uniref:G-protein coupled receptors family 1 profile domain-containing protein n=1 Tax=Xenoophorus captivus TaxID=1517983 RepID=A0ABV0SBP1_9TELE
MVTETYRSSDWSAFSETPRGTNITELERDPLLAVAEVVVLAVILLLALIGNGLVLVVLLKRRQHHSPLHQFMLNLCVADLVVALFQVFIFSRSEVAPGVYECWGHFAQSWGLKAYVTWMALAIFIIPVLIITFCQVKKAGPQLKRC